MTKIRLQTGDAPNIARNKAAATPKPKKFRHYSTRSSCWSPTGGAHPCVAFLPCRASGCQTQIRALPQAIEHVRRPYPCPPDDPGSPPIAGCQADWGLCSDRHELGRPRVPAPDPVHSGDHPIPGLRSLCLADRSLSGMPHRSAPGARNDPEAIGKHPWCRPHYDSRLGKRSARAFPKETRTRRCVPSLRTVEVAREIARCRRFYSTPNASSFSQRFLVWSPHYGELE